MTLSGDLEPGWYKKCSLELEEFKLTTETGAETFTSVWYVNHPSSVRVVAHVAISDILRARWMIENLGRIVIREVEKESFVGGSFSGLLEFPPSFSVASKQDVSLSH